MDWLLIVLRLTHIVSGVLWVGMMAFNVLFLSPAMVDAGKSAGPVMMGLQRRRLMTVMPIIALLTIFSGMWLMERVWGGMAGFTASPIGIAFLTGAVLALTAFGVGMLVMRPAMMRAAALAQELSSGEGGADRDTRAAELERLRARGVVMGRIVLALLLLATGAMAVARYL